MGQAEIVGQGLIEPCPQCGAPLLSVPGQIVVGDRLEWSISSTCNGCKAQIEYCGADEMPEEFRQVVLARDGVARVRIDPESARALRVPILRVLRRYGATVDEAADTFRRLAGAGLTGTQAEMRLLADRLDAVNAATRLDR
ncbi:hypothetical protein [Dactylosporangium sp. CA-092794]|uniref:hypothetical protein n=1 Tax=Dactylosporangium sp. CA-092794 TaxID=3239929 RepID=UPI003D8B9591